MSRRHYFDLALDDPAVPAPGDVLRSAVTDRLIIEAWPTDSRVWGNRWTLTVGDPVPAGQLAPSLGRQLFRSSTYRRGEGPHDFFGEP